MFVVVHYLFIYTGTEQCSIVIEQAIFVHDKMVFSRSGGSDYT